MVKDAKGKEKGKPKPIPRKHGPSDDAQK